MRGAMRFWAAFGHIFPGFFDGFLKKARNFASCFPLFPPQHALYAGARVRVGDVRM